MDNKFYIFAGFRDYVFTFKNKKKQKICEEKLRIIKFYIKFGQLPFGSEIYKEFKPRMRKTKRVYINDINQLSDLTEYAKKLTNKWIKEQVIPYLVKKHGDIDLISFKDIEEEEEEEGN